MSRLASVFASVWCCAALLSGCLLPKPKPPVYAKLSVPALQVHGDAEVSQDGLDVTITPITAGNVHKFPELWRTTTINRTTPSTTGGAATTTSTLYSIAIAPLPAFQVRIVNNTGHVVRLTTAIFRLENNTGKRWDTFSSSSELLAWNAAGVSTPELLTLIQTSLGGLQLLNRTVELLKGDEWSGYLVFNLGFTKATDYMDLMNATERFSLRLAELPVETSDAGEVTKTTEFTFALDKAMVEVDAVCPPGTAEPSWQNGCQQQR